MTIITMLLLVIDLCVNRADAVVGLFVPYLFGHFQSFVSNDAPGSNVLCEAMHLAFDALAIETQPRLTAPSCLVTGNTSDGLMVIIPNNTHTHHTIHLLAMHYEIKSLCIAWLIYSFHS